MDYWIGIDMGTTATKAVLYTGSGAIVATQSIAYTLYRDPSGMAEEAPEDIFDAVVATIRAVSEKLTAADKLCAIGFSAQQHSLIATTSDFNPLTRVITWADTRANAAATALRNADQGHNIFMRTGTPIQPMSPLSKLHWLKHDQPDLFQAADHFMDIKTYVFHRLFGVYKLDLSLASATGLYHLEKQQWDQDILDLLGLSLDQLPEIVSPYAFESGLSLADAQMMHIPPETPFVWGAADGPMSNLGVAAIQPGIAALTIGTSGAIRVMTNQPIVDEKMRTFTYGLDETHWVVGGATNSGASVLAWLKEKIFDDRITLDTMTQMAASISAGSGGLIFHPYLGGERAPIWDATARGSFFGLGYEHGQAEMTRAVLEGISYNIHAIAVALEEVVGELKHIQATGGFTNSEIWLQILADIFDMPIHIPDSQEAGCLAAVILSQKALGVMASFDEVTQLVTTRAVYTPLTEHLSTYRELEALYTDLLTHYQTTYGKLSEFKRR